jgi:transposase
MIVSIFLPNSEFLELEGMTAENEAIIFNARSIQHKPVCPQCDHPSHKVHSCYERKVADLPWLGMAVKLLLTVRRLFCVNPKCPQRIFAERLPELVQPYGRRTMRMVDVLTVIGFSVNGEGGARIARQLNMVVSPDTMLRCMKRFQHNPYKTPRVLGIDDFAFRRGHNYGTILVDLERRKVIDLLPDRTADTLAQWLQEHPGVEIISRDRSGSYADGAGRGAPQAEQVADRWHLMKNLGEALARFLDRNSKILRQALLRPEDVPLEKISGSVSEAEKHLETQTGPCKCKGVMTTKANQIKAMRRQRRLDRYHEVNVLYEQGYKIRAIAKKVKMSRNTVKRYIHTDEFPEIAKRNSTSSKLHPFKNYLKERWDSGCHNSAQLWNEIIPQGFRGSASLVRHYVAGFRNYCEETVKASPEPLRLPSTRRMAFLLTQDVESDDLEKRSYIDRLYKLSPKVEQAATLCKTFIEMVRERQHDRLALWINAVKKSGIPDLVNFANGIGRDQAAVEAALRLEWSNGQVEGQINRLKMIKRLMYGRSSFELLRSRVLYDL